MCQCEGSVFSPLVYIHLLVALKPCSFLSMVRLLSPLFSLFMGVYDFCRLIFSSIASLGLLFFRMWIMDW